jgi:DNA-binding MarR family transcriptional regulator
VTKPRATKPGFRVSARFRAEHPDADVTATELVINVLVAAGLVLNQLEQLLRRHRLSVGSFNTLQVVAGADEPLTPSEISRRIPVPVTTATMTGILDTAERRNLVARVPHPDDRRRILVHITDEGRALLDEVVPQVLEHEQVWTAGLTRAQRVALTDTLGVLQEHVRSLRDET